MAGKFRLIQKCYPKVVYKVPEVWFEFLDSYPTTWRMLLPFSVVIFPQNNKKEGNNAAAAP